jgi:L-seryl-tRNA(Ser) seleniumtransferase
VTPVGPVQDPRSVPPSIDTMARSLTDLGLPHPLLVLAAREAVEAGQPDSARSRANAIRDLFIRPVINATGVLLHTNLGRAPVEVAEAARYHNLEFDLAVGARGSRAGAIEVMLARASGAEAAMVVNNGAAAVLLVLTVIARGSPVVISRGELVEIGGGFRVPEVMEASGARLIEVGTTNRTDVDDYTRAVAANPDTALVLKVHTSNYRISGFTASVGVNQLASLGLPLVFDIGSGLLDANVPWLPGPPPAWLADEPAARQSLEAGADLVTFSGDKLLGGPQAGIIAGRADLIARCARHPLARALRPGGMVLSVLQETALAYLRRDCAATIPFWRMASVPVESLRRRATAIGVGKVVACSSVPGGGSGPGLTIPSIGVAVEGDHTAALRRHDLPVIARAHDGQTICDLRTVDPDDDEMLGKALQALPLVEADRPTSDGSLPA